MKTLIVIPALNPDKNLIMYVEQLILKGFDDILIIDDGSNTEKQEIFRTLEERKECHLFHHAINLGKGRALKNGINYFLTQRDTEKYLGIITVDSDGQHLVDDVHQMAGLLTVYDDKLILGVRNFSAGNVPPKSKIGNRLTCGVFRLMWGEKLRDTQTGLRAIPTGIASNYIQLAGERFEYETNMLIETITNKTGFIQQDINTVYIDNNSETHFNPIKDSIAIYKLLFASFLRFSITSIFSFVVDIIAFQILLWGLASINPLRSIWIATIGARMLSSIFNYSTNRKLVFKNKSRVINTIFRYYILCVIQMVCSAFLVSFFYRYLKFNQVAIKVMVDSILFCVSYMIQRKFVFS